MSKFKLEEGTVEILKNFAEINQNIIIERQTATMAPSEEMFAVAEFDEIPEGVEIPLYNLLEVVTLHGIMHDPVFIPDEKLMVIQDEQSKTECEYYYTFKDFLNVPKRKTVNMPDSEVQITIPQQYLQSALKTARIINAPDFAICGDGKEVFIKLTDITNETANTFRMSPLAETDANFEFHIKTNRIKVIPADYDVELSSKGLTKWENESLRLTYWIAIDKSSVWNG